MIYHQDESQVGLTRELLGLSQSEAHLISMLTPGQALRRVGARSLWSPTAARALEARLTNTDTGMHASAARCAAR